LGAAWHYGDGDHQPAVCHNLPSHCAHHERAEGAGGPGQEDRRPLEAARQPGEAQVAGPLRRRGHGGPCGTQHLLLCFLRGAGNFRMAQTLAGKRGPRGQQEYTRQARTLLNMSSPLNATAQRRPSLRKTPTHQRTRSGPSRLCCSSTSTFGTRTAMESAHLLRSCRAALCL